MKAFFNTAAALAIAVASLAGCGTVKDFQPAMAGLVEGKVNRPVKGAQAEGTYQLQAAAITDANLLVKTDIPYGPNPLQALDVCGTKLALSKRPVLIYVHGGGWKQGDKSHKVETKRAYFQQLGYVYVSLNYRLADPNVPESSRAMHPVQVRDVCRGINWVRQNIRAYGGDPDRICLMGHSAGAHLVNLAGTHSRYLSEAVGSTGLRALKGVISVDTASHDLTGTLSPGLEALVRNAFGTNPLVRWDASPLKQCASGKGMPPFLTITRGTDDRIAESRDFFRATLMADPLQAGDAFLQTTAYDHEGINAAIGLPGETIVTPAITRFLQARFGE